MKDNQNVQATGYKPLSNALKYCYGVGDAFFNMMTSIESFYFNTFLTDLSGLPLGMATLVASVISTVDALISWVYGGILNALKPMKWGRYRSWYIAVPWIVPFLYACQFLKLDINPGLNAVIICAGGILSHFIWNFAYVANVTMIAVAGKTPEDRATLSSSRATWNNIGAMAFSYTGLPLATVLAGVVGENNKFAAIAFIIAACMAVTYFAHFKMFEGYEATGAEAASEKKGGSVSIGLMLKSLFANPQLLVLIIADIAKWCVKFVTAASAIYYFRDAAGNAGLMTIYTLLISLASTIGGFAMRYIAKAMSNRTASLVAYAGMAIFCIAIYFAYANATLVIILMVIAQFFYGVSYACNSSLFADVCIYTHWKTGENPSGWISGLQNLPLKVAVFLRAPIINAVLAAIGWQSGVLLEGTARQGMAIPFGLVPGVFCVVGLLLILFGYKLTDAKIKECQKELDARG